MAAMTFFRASSHEAQKPSEAEQVAQISVMTTGNSMSVRKFLVLLLPRKDSTMSLLVVSVATKPVMSEMMLFSNSETVLVLAASTSGQLPWGQVILVLGESLFPRQ
jgi:hypothetical protein